MTANLDVESVFRNACAKQGLEPDRATTIKAVTDMTGRVSVTDDGTFMVQMPEHGRSITLPSYLHWLRAILPEDAFAHVGGPGKRDHHQPATTAEPVNLTQQMKETVAASRSRSKPDDWEQRRAKATGMTREMMDAIAAGAKSARR